MCVCVCVCVCVCERALNPLTGLQAALSFVHSFLSSHVRRSRRCRSPHAGFRRSGPSTGRGRGEPVRRHRHVHHLPSSHARRRGYKRFFFGATLQLDTPAREYSRLSSPAAHLTAPVASPRLFLKWQDSRGRCSVLVGYPATASTDTCGHSSARFSPLATHSFLHRLSFPTEWRCLDPRSTTSPKYPLATFLNLSNVGGAYYLRIENAEGNVLIAVYLFK